MTTKRHSIPKRKWPKYLLKHKKFAKGVSVHGCIAGDSLDHAHAHCHPDDPNYGWICLEYMAYFKSSKLMKHELAHLIIPYQNHTKKWMRTVLALGGSIDPYDVKVSKSFTLPVAGFKK